MINKFLSKMSLPLDNGSRLTRKWFGIDSNLSRFSLASLICLCMLTLGVGNAWGANYEIMDPSSESLVNGKNYLIAIHDRKSGIYYFIQSGSTKHLSQTVTNGIVSNPNAATIWTATASSTNWQFRKKDANSNGYLYNSGSNTTLNTNNNSATTWYVGHGSSGSNPAYNYFKIQNGSNTGRYICWNGTVSGGTFGAYANSNWSGSGVQSASSNIAAGNGALQIFKEVASYTITAQSNNNSFGTVSLSGTTITATPESGYRVSTSTPYSISPANSATVSQSGNTFTVTPSANTTITINFEAIPTHTLTFSINGGSCATSSESVAEGATYTPLPTVTGLTSSCEYGTFVGWTTESSTYVHGTSSLYTTSYEMGDANVTLHAVYSKTTGGSSPTAYSAGDTGDFVIASFNTSDEKWYAIPQNPTVSSGKIAGVEITVGESGGVYYVTPANATGYTWNIRLNTNGSCSQSLYDAANSKALYHSNGGTSGTNLSYGTSTGYGWDIDTETNGLTFQGVGISSNTCTTNSRGMLMNGTNFGGYSLTNEDASGYYRIQVLPIASAGTTTYSLDANCCTALGTINGSFF